MVVRQMEERGEKDTDREGEREIIMENEKEISDLKKWNGCAVFGLT